MVFIDRPSKMPLEKSPIFDWSCRKRPKVIIISDRKIVFRLLQSSFLLFLRFYYLWRCIIFSIFGSGSEPEEVTSALGTGKRMNRPIIRRHIVVGRIIMQYIALVAIVFPGTGERRDFSQGPPPLRVKSRLSSYVSVAATSPGH